MESKKHGSPLTNIHSVSSCLHCKRQRDTKEILKSKHLWYCCSSSIDKRILVWVRNVFIVLTILIYLIYVLVSQDPESIQAWAMLSMLLTHFAKLEAIPKQDNDDDEDTDSDTDD